MDSLLEVKDLCVEVPRQGEWVRVVDNVSLEVGSGESVGLVGESGSGKSLTLAACLGLLESRGARISKGSIRFQGVELLEDSGRAMRNARGRDISAIFQQAAESLNPSKRVGEQIAESARHQLGMSRADAWDRAVQLLKRVGIIDAERRARSFPHEFSGGMAQRVCIAAAMVGQPKLILADEPTTGLDVTVQRRVLDLLAELQDEFGVAIILVSHDLRVVSSFCSRIYSMYCGEIVESGPAANMVFHPNHPYSSGIICAVKGSERGRDEPFRTIPGVVPDPAELPSGCRFGPRCTHCIEGRCDVGSIELQPIGLSHKSRCIRVGELELEGAK